ncbi:MAG: pitrilysin family protein [Thermoanaerobaculia bacterium]
MKTESSAILLICLAFACPRGLGGQVEEDIAPHPRALTFGQVSVALPSAEGRAVQLDTGPLVFLAADHTLPLVEIAVALRVGSFLDPPGKVGLASLTGALVRRGGTTQIEAAELDVRIDHLGARLGSFAGITRGGASLSAPTWVLDEALELFVEILREPGFQMEQLRAAKDNLRESMMRRNEDPLEILQREWEWLMFGDDHFSTAPLTLESLEAITRQDLVAHHRRYWRPEHMLLAVSGDFEREKLLARLEELFTGWPPSDDPAAGQTASAPVPWPPAGPPAGAGPGLFHVEADTPQAKIALGYRAAARLDWTDSDRFALEVVLEILGGSGAISRLAGRLRTAEGLVYRASAAYEVGTLWPEYFQAFFDTDNRNAARAIDLAWEEIERLRTQSIHPRELEVVKQTLLSRLRLSFDTAEEISGRFAEDRLIGRPHSYWESYRNGIEQVTVDDVRRAAHQFLLPEKLLFLVVGRWAELSAGMPEGESDLEKVTGHRVTHLPLRDPLTMEPVD